MNNSATFKATIATCITIVCMSFLIVMIRKRTPSEETAAKWGALMKSREISPNGIYVQTNGGFELILDGKHLWTITNHEGAWMIISNTPKP